MNFLLGQVFKLVGKLLAMLGVYVAGHRAGSQKAALKSHRAAAKMRKKADEIDAEIAASSDDDVRRQLHNDADPD